MKTKIFTNLILGTMLLASPLSQAQILADGDFSATTTIQSYFIFDETNAPPDGVWWAWQNWQINADATVVDEVCKYTLNSIGWYRNTWDIQLNQTGFPLNLGHSYRLSFRVKADEDRSFGVYLGENGGWWSGLIGNNNHIQNAKKDDWQTITIYFDATCVFTSHKLSFELGYEQVNTYFDDILLEDLGPYTTTIGILGSAVNGWDVDADMQTTDEKIYTLSNYPLNSGEAKFRKDNSWCTNWGSTDFPSGSGYQDGPNIPILCGCNYDITFNIQTGEYSFTINDTDPPVITGIGDNLEPLWSPNHQMVPVQLNYSIEDNCCTSVTNTVTISSNEPVNGLGDGDKSPDWKIIDEHNILLRAERSGKGTGRVYTITIVSTDASGNSSSKQVTVSVPHDKKDLKAAEGTSEPVDQVTSFLNKNENNQIDVKTWPNPAIRNFNLKVQSASTEIIDVYVTDVSGRLVSRLKAKNEQSINFGDDLQPGMYFIKIRQGDSFKTIKVVKQ